MSFSLPETAQTEQRTSGSVQHTQSIRILHTKSYVSHPYQSGHAEQASFIDTAGHTMREIQLERMLDLDLRPRAARAVRAAHIGLSGAVVLTISQHTRHTTLRRCQDRCQAANCASPARKIVRPKCPKQPKRPLTPCFASKNCHGLSG